MIKNIVFDVGNVIWKGNSKSIANYIKIDNEEDIAKVSTFFEGFRLMDLDEETVEEHYEKWKYNNKINNDKYKDQLVNYYKNREFNSGIINLINKLKENNYKVYVLSNNNKSAINYLKKCEEVKNIDGWVVSYEYKLVKPDEEFFKVLFNKFNLNPEECFFVDDKEKNINAGKKLGMNGHVLDYENNGVNKLIDDLKLNGVDI
ncbi:MAG: HAD-IA family hydrolase [Bacilli bacterium]|nr:HAD-IA family hydrolase [Bacilli bacterium]